MTNLFDTLNKDGKFPGVSLLVYPLNNKTPFRFPRYNSSGKVSSGFLNYEFESNILIPVDSFSFSFAAPDDVAIYDLIRDGDLVQLMAGEHVVSTGIVDGIEIMIDSDRGEIATIHGRDLMSQLEDQSAINDLDRPMWANSTTILSAAQNLIKNTRIIGVTMQDAPHGAKYQFPTEPGESKLSALARFLDPLNCVAWMSPDGRLVIGKPNFTQAPRTTEGFYIDRDNRKSNVMSAKILRNSTQIPNAIISIWTGQENVQNSVAPKQKIVNTAKRPRQLLTGHHYVTKTIVTSTPTAYDPSFVNTVTVNNFNAKDLLEALALRELAKANVGELRVEIEVPGHYDSAGRPYQMNTVFEINIPRASVKSKRMYCYSVRYGLEEGRGQFSVLSFCNLKTIVSDVRAP